jgi:tetratricopeptide (TPR) repeat protein
MTVAATAATVYLLGGVLTDNAGSVQNSQVSRAAADPVAALQRRVAANPRDAQALTELGLAYQQRARETGDPSWYPKSDGVLRKALILKPRNALTLSGLGSLALARHRFATALVLGRRAVTLDPGEARHRGVVGDALIELGQYDAAFRSFDRMASLAPGVSSYTRISYARELLGRPAAAIIPMRLAADGASGEAYAWTRVQLGKLYFSLGRIDAAARQHELALRALPGYVHALDALAQVEAARGHLRRAIVLERRAVDTIPLPQFVATLGDLYGAAGRPAEARRQYALIGAMDRLLGANGVRTDLEVALFDVDHGIKLGRALRRARLAHRARPGIEADDVLAWALARNGHCGEALGYSRRALRLGTRDALKYFHRGMIERCLGHRAESRSWFRRALELNPHFSILWAPTARRLA